MNLWPQAWSYLAKWVLKGGWRGKACRVPFPTGHILYPPPLEACLRAFLCIWWYNPILYQMFIFLGKSHRRWGSLLQQEVPSQWVRAVLISEHLLRGGESVSMERIAPSAPEAPRSGWCLFREQVCSLVSTDEFQWVRWSFVYCHVPTPAILKQAAKTPRASSSVEANYKLLSVWLLRDATFPLYNEPAVCGKEWLKNKWTHCLKGEFLSLSIALWLTGLLFCSGGERTKVQRANREINTARLMARFCVAKVKEQAPG